MECHTSLPFCLIFSAYSFHFLINSSSVKGVLGFPSVLSVSSIDDFVFLPAFLIEMVVFGKLGTELIFFTGCSSDFKTSCLLYVEAIDCELVEVNSVDGSMKSASSSISSWLFFLIQPTEATIIQLISVYYWMCGIQYQRYLKFLNPQ